MFDKIFDKDRVNTGRQRELDLVKAFSIIMMIITHCIDDLYAGYADHLPFLVIDDVLAQTVGAAGFMICMGAGIAYVNNTSPDSFVRRGISLLMIGQVLNIIRYAIPGLISFLVTGDERARDFCMLTFSSDILQFAGLFFICMGLFSKLKLKGWQIFIVSVIANLIAMALNAKIHTGIYGIDQFFGMFVFTESESYFPLLHWMIYPAFGIMFGDILKHVKDKNRFYGILIVPTLIIRVVYYYIGIYAHQSVLKFYYEYQSMAYVNIFDALLQLVCNLYVICLFWFIGRLFTDKMMSKVNFVSKNINRYYCVHSVLIYIVSVTIATFLEEGAVNTPVCYLFCVVIIALTTLIVWLYDARLYTHTHAFFSKNIYLWYALIVIVTIAACGFASMGINNYPNLLNEYNEWI